MPINILMPALSPTMEKGNLAKWLKKEGDSIKAGDVIAEIETDKATMEVEAVDEGILAKIVVAAGTSDVPVNQLIGVIAAEGEDVAAAAAGGGAPAKAAPAPAAAPAAAAAASSPPVGGAAAKAAGGGGRLFASPLARRIAKDAGVDLAKVKGTGPHGRIVMADVEAAKTGGTATAAAPAAAAAAPAKAAAPAGPSDEAVKKMFPAGSFEEVPHDGMRKTIARRLLESKQTVPHFYLTIDCELDALLKLRETINASAPVKDGKPSFKVSVNDFVIKAMALALNRVPEANVSWTDNAMLKHKHSDVGVAVSIPGGLITPIIRAAETKTLSVISNEMKDMAARAKARKLKPEEYQGGTTAVSNLGMFGVKDFAAIINPPQAMILAVGAGEERAVVRKGQVVVRNMMNCTLAVDHRVVDGAMGAQFLQTLRSYVEQPAAMLA